MYYLPTSSLILLFLISLFYPFPCASSQKEREWCQTLFQCGSITAGFPFWGGNRYKHCGHPLLELHCLDNDITSLTISDHLYHVLHIDHTYNTLRLARLESICSSTFTNTTLPPEIFDLSPTYTTVTFYRCLADQTHLLSYPCPGKGQNSVSVNPEYHHDNCHASFTVNVPTNFVTEEKKLTIANLLSVLGEGFEVKVKVDAKACQECLSSHKYCGFNESLPLEVKCGPLLPPPVNKNMGGAKLSFSVGTSPLVFPSLVGIAPQICGHPLLELHCFNNTTSIIISDHLYNVLHIDQTSKTIKLARAELQGSFCNATFTSTTLPSEIFELSSTYKSLAVFYLCDPKLSYHSSYICLGRGPVSVSQNLDYHKSCQGSFMINVPKSFVPEEKELNLAHLESALREGFEVKVKIDEKACQKCSSSHGICGFENTQICCKEASSTRCNKLHPPDATELELHKRCSGPFSCGDQRELFYPFWTSDREGCGHPEFKLNCSGGIAELSISSVKFRILEANYGSGIIRLARLDYINDNLCPQDPIDALFDENILPFAPNTELLTFYYNCGRDFSQRVSTYVGELACGDDSDDEKYYYVTRNLSSPLLQGIGTFLSELRGFCNRNVTIPASGLALNELQKTSSRDNLKKALEYGFELGPNQECLKCIGDAGACGYNQSSNSFACYRIEEPQNRPRNKDTGLSVGAIAGIAAASVLGLAIFIIVGWLCLIRRRRKTQEAQYTSKDLPITSYSSRETSRNPTSTTISSSSNHSFLPSLSNIGNGSDYYGVQVFSYEELEEATENFSRELGDGGFGTVYYGLLKDGRAVAVKRLYERSLKRVEQFKNEIEILKSLKHPNLVILYGCTSRHSRELLLVYEYISNGTLAEHLHGDRAEARPLCWSTRLKVAIETASALSYLHKSGIIHRDVKTTNILLDDNYQVKVADFGLSRLFPMDQTHISTAPQGTPGYVDPEYYQCYRLNEKSDVYSFGVVLTELISSKEAVDITRHRHDINLANMAVSKIQNNALHELVDPSLGFEKDLDVRRKMMSVAELAFRCLQQEREVRPSMDEIVEILKGIKEEEKRVLLVESPDVVDIQGGGDDVGLLRNSVPPPVSPETDKWTSSSDTAASL